MPRRSTIAALAAIMVVVSAVQLLAAECRRFELSVVADGAALEEYPWRGRTYIEALRGRSFALRVSNPTSERVAVALSVDGRNVIDAKHTTALGATKWILWPGQSVEIPGWQVSGDTARRFFFTDTARSYANWLGDASNVGTIEAVFFRERRPVAPIAVEEPRKCPPLRPLGSQDHPAPPCPAADQAGASGETSSVDREARSPAPQGPKSQQAPSSGALAGGEKDVKDSFAATGIGQRTRFPVEWISFDEDPTPVARIALRYEFRRELVALGVLPRAEDLSSRDQARGFSPEYAPDPDRHRAQ